MPSKSEIRRYCALNPDRVVDRLFELETENAKLRAVAEAAKAAMRSEVVRSAPFASYSEALLNLEQALAALDGKGEP